jgi:hypothetical protein
MRTASVEHVEIGAVHAGTGADERRFAVAGCHCAAGNGGGKHRKHQLSRSCQLRSQGELSGPKTDTGRESSSHVTLLCYKSIVYNVY